MLLIHFQLLIQFPSEFRMFYAIIYVKTQQNAMKKEITFTGFYFIYLFDLGLKKKMKTA